MKPKTDIEKIDELEKTIRDTKILEICLIVFATIVFFWSVLK